MAETLFPVVCMSCGKAIGNKYETFLAHMRSSPLATVLGFFDKYKIERICCRRHFLTHVELIWIDDGLPTGRAIIDVDTLKAK
jgi:DNA-directed RNA polymerase subunit N (RpoN/RPB10)